MSAFVNIVDGDTGLVWLCIDTDAGCVPLYPVGTLASMRLDGADTVRNLRPYDPDLITVVNMER